MRGSNGLSWLGAQREGGKAWRQKPHLVAQSRDGESKSMTNTTQAVTDIQRPLPSAGEEYTL